MAGNGIPAKVFLRPGPQFPLTMASLLAQGFWKSHWGRRTEVTNFLRLCPAKLECFYCRRWKHTVSPSFTGRSPDIVASAFTKGLGSSFMTLEFSI